MGSSSSAANSSTVGMPRPPFAIPVGAQSSSVVVPASKTSELQSSTTTAMATLGAKTVDDIKAFEKLVDTLAKNAEEKILKDALEIVKKKRQDDVKKDANGLEQSYQQFYQNKNAGMRTLKHVLSETALVAAATFVPADAKQSAKPITILHYSRPIFHAIEALGRMVKDDKSFALGLFKIANKDILTRSKKRNGAIKIKTDTEIRDGFEHALFADEDNASLAAIQNASVLLLLCIGERITKPENILGYSPTGDILKLVLQFYAAHQNKVTIVCGEHDDITQEATIATQDAKAKQVKFNKEHDDIKDSDQVIRSTPQEIMGSPAFKKVAKYLVEALNKKDNPVLKAAMLDASEHLAQQFISHIKVKKEQEMKAQEAKAQEAKQLPVRGVRSEIETQARHSPGSSSSADSFGSTLFSSGDSTPTGSPSRKVHGSAVHTPPYRGRSRSVERHHSPQKRSASAPLSQVLMGGARVPLPSQNQGAHELSHAELAKKMREKAFELAVKAQALELMGKDPIAFLNTCIVAYPDAKSVASAGVASAGQGQRLFDGTVSSRNDAKTSSFPHKDDKNHSRGAKQPHHSPGKK